MSAANVSEENEKLTSATCKKLTYTDMRTTILKMFGDPAGEDETGTPAIKQEPVFQTEHKSVVWLTEEDLIKEEVDDVAVVEEEATNVDSVNFKREIAQ